MDATSATTIQIKVITRAIVISALIISFPYASKKKSLYFSLTTAYTSSEELANRGRCSKELFKFAQSFCENGMTICLLSTAFSDYQLFSIRRATAEDQFTNSSLAGTIQIICPGNYIILEAWSKAVLFGIALASSNSILERLSE